jgi:hypothetical protein
MNPLLHGILSSQHTRLLMFVTLMHSRVLLWRSCAFQSGAEVGSRAAAGWRLYPGDLLAVQSISITVWLMCIDLQQLLRLRI